MLIPSPLPPLRVPLRRPLGLPSPGVAKVESTPTAPVTPVKAAAPVHDDDGPTYVFATGPVTIFGAGGDQVTIDPGHLAPRELSTADFLALRAFAWR
ncbi:MAG: hypothetical protein H6745_27240 [Deltaproteobacteria bacterium]|nr:hypothetical protein [Deltaproteobacteria bacterium]